MYTTQPDKVDCTGLHNDDAHAELFGGGVFTGIPSLMFVLLAALDLSYPAATSILVGTFATYARIRGVGGFRLEITLS